jgi:hypothetical protein
MLEEANRFLEQEYLREFNQRFQVLAAQPGSAFLPCRRKDLDFLFSVQQSRVVGGDKTVVVGGKILQIEATRWRGHASRMHGDRLRTPGPELEYSLWASCGGTLQRSGMALSA